MMLTQFSSLSSDSQCSHRHFPQFCDSLNELLFLQQFVADTMGPSESDHSSCKYFASLNGTLWAERPCLICQHLSLKHATLVKDLYLLCEWQKMR